jgi:hypothetical protein
LGVALFEGDSDFVGFSSEPDKKFAILSVKLFSGTGTGSNTGGTGHGTCIGGGATLAVAQAVSKSGIPSSNIPYLTILLLSHPICTHLKILLNFHRLFHRLGVLSVLRSLLFIPSLLYFCLAILTTLIIPSSRRYANSHYRREDHPRIHFGSVK